MIDHSEDTNPGRARVASPAPIAHHAGGGPATSRGIRTALRKLTALLLLGSGAFFLVLSLSSTGNAARKDFIAYWAAGQLLIRGGNPYDEASVLHVERSAGFAEAKPLVMRNPPYVLPLALPLGLVGPTLGVILWSIAIVVSLMVSVRILCLYFGRSSDRLHLLIYVFAPTLSCVQFGQTSTLALFGLALFLYLQRAHPFSSGLCIPLFAIKPHLLIPLGTVLILSGYTCKARRTLFGAAVAAGLALLVAVCFNPYVIPAYMPVLRAAGIDSPYIPTISSGIRWLFPGAAWMQFVPVIGSSCWGVWYFSRHRREWDWGSHGLTVLMVSIWSAPYSWFTDQIIMAPAVLRAIYVTDDAGRSLWSLALLDSAALLLVFIGIHIGSPAYIWTSSAWLLWYALSIRHASGQHAAKVGASGSGRDCRARST